MLNETNLVIAVKWLKQADAVLLAAGAGLSADCGIDYLDEQDFANDYPALVKMGFQNRAQLMGYEGWRPLLKWGYLAHHANKIRFEQAVHYLYRYLFNLIADKDYFVITTNVDGMFLKSGFNSTLVFTPQGDYANMQCQRPCTDYIWESKASIDRIIPFIDKETQLVKNSRLLPRCPFCGGDTMLNVRGGNWFVESKYINHARAYTKWIKDKATSKLVIIEIGVGFSTPGIIRWPVERIVEKYSQARLIRINKSDASVSCNIGNRALGFKNSAKNVISDFYQY